MQQTLCQVASSNGIKPSHVIVIIIIINSFPFCYSLHDKEPIFYYYFVKLCAEVCALMTERIFHLEKVFTSLKHISRTMSPGLYIFVEIRDAGYRLIS